MSSPVTRLPSVDFLANLVPPTTVSDFVDIVERLAGEECGVLRSWLSELEAARQHHFLHFMLPKIFTLVKETANIFPSVYYDTLPHGSSGATSFTRKEAGCLIGHMFLCTTPKFGASRSSYGNFLPWFATADFVDTKDPRLAYLNSLLLYFDQFFAMSVVELDERLGFERISLNNVINWDRCTTRIHANNVDVGREGKIGDAPGSEVEVTFANRDIGFGKSATQEEIVFGMSPELCPAVLLFDSLMSTEAILISGARKICDHRGYGRTLHSDRCLTDACKGYNPASRVVLLADAIDFNVVETGVNQSWLELQLQPQNIHRELNKLYAGFDICRRRFDALPIASGKWGCGVFGGHPVVKCILQIAVAAALDRQLILYVSSDHVLQAILTQFLNAYDGATIADVLQELMRIDISNRDDVSGSVIGQMIRQYSSQIE